jgi:hypothetical protein
MVLVDVDLVGDHLQALGERADLGGNLVLVPAQQRESVGLVAWSVPDEVGVAADRAQRHAGGAEPGAQVQPLHVVLAVETMPVAAAPDGFSEEALALVEAQRVDAQPRLLGDLPDGQFRCALTHTVQDSRLT